MTVRFIPTGELDINTDPSQLPSQVVDNTEISGAMTRCTNLTLDSKGTAVTRNGSSKINSTAIDQTTPHLIVEMGGDRCVFAGTKAYWNENVIEDSLTSARWSAIKYSSYNVETQSIFAVNGTERKRITNNSTVTEKYDYAYAHTWEAAQVSGTTYQFGTTRSNYQCWYDWEKGDDGSVDDSVERRFLWIFEGIVVREWGIEAPEDPPIVYTMGSLRTSLLNGVKGYAFLYGWEKEYHANDDSFQFGKTQEETVKTVRYVPIPVCNPHNGSLTYTYFPLSENVVKLWQTTHDWEKSKTPSADTVNFKYMYMWENANSYDDNKLVGVKYTYCRKSGVTLECESNPSPAEYVERRDHVSITWPYPEDPQVTHVRAYRTLADGVIFFYAGEFDVNDSVGSLEISDFSLGSEVEIDHDRPLAGTVVAGPTYNGYCFMLKDNKLYFSKPNQPEYWPAAYYIEVGPIQEPLKGIEIHNGIPYVASTEEVYMVQGTGADSFFPFPMRAKTGSVSDLGMLSVAGFGVLHTDVDGFYSFEGPNNDKKTSENNFGALFKNETKGSMPYVNRTYIENCWFLAYKNKLWFGYPDSTAVYPNNVIVSNMATGRSEHISYAFQIGAATVDSVNNRILGLDSLGYIRELDDADATTDDGTAIAWQVETKAYTDQLYKYFPRKAKYDINLGTGATATSSILLDDTVIQTHALTTSRSTKSRLVNGKNGDRLGVRIAGTGAVTIRMAEVE